MPKAKSFEPSLPYPLILQKNIKTHIVKIYKDLWQFNR